MFKLGFLKKSMKSLETESADIDIAEFEKYSDRYSELVRQQEFSKENVEQLHQLQKSMLNMLLSN